MRTTFNNSKLSSSRLLFFSIGALLLQVAVLPFLPNVPAIDLFGIVIITSAFLLTLRNLLPIAIGGGVLIDIFSFLMPIGISSILYAVAVGSAHIAGRFFHVRSLSLSSVIIMSAVITLLYVVQHALIIGTGIVLTDLIATLIVGLIYSAFLLHT